MEDLIKALQIFLKYGNRYYPTYCEHDELIIVGIKPKSVTDEDKKTLHELGFFVGKNESGNEIFYSFRFGSA